ncbi:MAG: hypothetical protein ACRC35_03130 [Angustibacter sp.]
MKKVIKEAKYADRYQRPAGEQSWFRVSVWADVARQDESEDELKLRLVHAAGLAGIRLEDVRNAVFYWTRAGTLYDLGFDLKKDGDHDEREEHYSVDFGSDPARPVVERFVQALKGPEQTGQVR